MFYVYIFGKKFLYFCTVRYKLSDICGHFRPLLLVPLLLSQRLFRSVTLVDDAIGRERIKSSIATYPVGNLDKLDPVVLAEHPETESLPFGSVDLVRYRQLGHGHSRTLLDLSRREVPTLSVR